MTSSIVTHDVRFRRIRNVLARAEYREADRRPVCRLTDFGDSSLNFVLRFWIRDPQQGLTNVRGKVLLAPCLPEIGGSQSVGTAAVAGIGFTGNLVDG